MLAWGWARIALNLIEWKYIQISYPVHSALNYYALAIISANFESVFVFKYWLKNNDWILSAPNILRLCRQKLARCWRLACRPLVQLWDRADDRDWAERLAYVTDLKCDGICNMLELSYWGLVGIYFVDIFENLILLLLFVYVLGPFVGIAHWFCILHKIAHVALVLVI